jgi:hypothetical protein
VHYPVYKAAPPRQAPRRGTTPLTFVLLITVPALVAVAALRPR